MNPALLCVAQMNAQDCIESNLKQIEWLMQESKAKQAQLLVLPENCVCFAPGKQRQTAEQFDYIQSRLEQLAYQYQLWLIAGTLPCPYRPDGTPVPNSRVRTVSLCISPEKTEARYDKIHLFDVNVADGIGQYQESLYFESGDQVVTTHTPFGTIGLMVCYDLRFPELALELRKQGADLLSAPAAFTYTTGQQHWQLLLQARALDTQCMILGAGQQGTHAKIRHTWGHSAIIDATGQVLSMIEESGLQLTAANFNLEQQNNIRQQMPLMTHRKLF